MARSTSDKTYFGFDKIRNSDRMREKWPSLPESIEAIPYYSTLRRALRSHGAAVLCAYLELKYPSSSSLPLLVPIHRVQADLQITARSWWWVSSPIATRYKSRSLLRAAQIANREFVRDLKGISGLITPYSLTLVDNVNQMWLLRRNALALQTLLTSAKLTGHQIAADYERLNPKSDVKTVLEARAPIDSQSAIDRANRAADAIERMAKPIKPIKSKR